MSPQACHPPSEQGFDEQRALDDLLNALSGQLQDVHAQQSDIGVISHMVIGLVAPVAETIAPSLLVEAVLVLSRAACAPGRQHRRNSTLVAGYVAEYLGGACRPRGPWRCLGAEYDTGAGRVDLAWQHSRTRAVFYDEIKTTLVARRAPEAAWLEQARRYAHAGAVKHGTAFVGVRLLPLGSMGAAVLVAPDGDLAPLRPSLRAPLFTNGVGQ